MKTPGSIVIGIPGLILCANTPGKVDSHKSLPIICDKVGEHILRDFWLYRNAELFRIIESLLTLETVVSENPRRSAAYEILKPLGSHFFPIMTFGVDKQLNLFNMSACF